MASQAGVFQYLIDAAEEEECKEMILVYYHLLTSAIPLTPQQLDQQIEEWMRTKNNKSINFNIDKTLENLQAIRGKLAHQEEIPLISFDSQGFCYALSLDEAKQVIDYVWDNAFKWNLN